MSASRIRAPGNSEKAHGRAAVHHNMTIEAFKRQQKIEAKEPRTPRHRGRRSYLPLSLRIFFWKILENLKV